MIELKDISGNIILSTPINTGSKKRYTLMKEDSITVRFSLGKPIAFRIGTFIDDTEIGLYELTEEYKPAYNTSTGGYDYELRLDSYYYKWKNKIFKYTPESGGREASWSLTASLDVHMGVFLRNLSALGYTYKGREFTFSIDSTVENSAKPVTYENTNMLDALSRMAETWGCEWWVTDNVIRFGRCEYGTAVDFEIGKNVEDMPSSGNRSTYATRVYAFGSTRNLPADYRPVETGAVVNGVVQKRLMLPEDTPYIDAYPDMPTEQAIEQVVVFDDVYPKTDGNISSVSTYESTANNEDGTQTTETSYRFKDDGITFSKDYILEGEELHVIFGSGSLNGMDFGVIFNPENEPEKLEDGSWNPKAQLWQIVANENYGRKLPDDVLKPKVGDTYVLYGWDSTKIADLGLVGEAEQELKRKAEKYVEKSKIDPNTYQCRMMSDYMYGLDGDGNLNPNFAKHFDIGDRVNLINDAFFDTGSRQSRIIGYEYNLDKPWDSPVFIVGETASYSRLSSLEEKVDSLTFKGQTYTGGGGSGVYIIGTNDTTPASNRNVYSAYRSQQEFLNKRRDDRSTGKIASDTGFEVGSFVSGASGAILYKDKATGQTVGELDKLRVRLKAYFESLEIVNVNSIGGKQVISPAGAVRLSMAFMPGEKYIAADGAIMQENDGAIMQENEFVVPPDVYRCFFLAEQDGQEVENRFKPGDQLQSKDFNITKPGEYNRVANHYYWRLVTGVSTQPVMIGELGYHYVDLSVTDCDTGSDAPAKGDVVAHLGNRDDVDRQNAIVFSSVDTFSPSITLYQGINSYSYLGKEMVSYGVDKTSGKAFFNVYGDSYVGDRGGNSYVKFTQGTGVEIKGKLSVESTIGDKGITEYIKENSGTDEETVLAIVKSVTDDLQNQIDGTVETHFYSGAPTLSNAPADGWVPAETETNKETYDKHVGDLYYDRDTGYGYRFMKDGNSYVWELLKDTDVTKALADAAKAQETADGKMKVFDHQPTDAEEYEVGDIWVNATYGNLYSNEILRAVTAKAAGAAFSIDHWTRASKYTDDSKANQVQANVDALGKTVNDMNKTVNDMRNFTDDAFADGVVDRSEKSAIENYLNNIETTKAEVAESYGKVYDNSLLDGVAKTNLANAYTAFGSAAGELKTTISGAIADGIATSVERASVDQKYTNFNTKYGEFIAYLNAANKYIQDKINANANKALEQVASLDYLKRAFKEKTLITDGLILSSMIALGYTSDDGEYNLMSGTNGIYDSTKRGGGIASWWGGGMLDRADYTADNMPANVATGLVRFDGTGYFANGNLWWDADGRIHADPQSFIINENQLGDYLELFQIIYRSGTKDIDYVIPQYPMQSLEVATEIRLGNGVLKWDEANQGFYVEKYGGGNAGFYATSYVSAKGVNSNSVGGGGGGLIQSVYGYNNLGGTFSDSNLTDTFNAYTINRLASRLSAVESGAPTSVSWNIITDKPTIFPTNWDNVAGKPDLSQYMMRRRIYTDFDPDNFVNIGIVETNSSTNAPTSNAWHQYMIWGTADKDYVFQMANHYTSDGHLYYRHKVNKVWKPWHKILNFTDLTWPNISGKPTTLSGYGITDGVNAVSITGTGNAVTTASISGHTITLSKGTTFLQKSTFDDMFEKVNVGTSSNPVYAIRAKYGFYSDSFVSAKGSNPDAGGSGGGLIQSVYGYSSLGGSFSDSNLTDTFNAYTINQLANRISTIESGAITSVDWSIVTGKPTTVAGYGITDAYTKTQSDGRYIGGISFKSHGNQSTSYTADTYSTNFVNKAFPAFAERGSWSFADNGYITTSLGLNINLSGTAIFQWGGSDTHKTQLFITPANSTGVSNPALNEMLFYTSNGSGYGAGWTRVLTNRNYTSFTNNNYYTKADSDSRYVNITGDTMTGRLQINTSSRYLKIGCENGTFAHYQTDAESGHWFNKSTYVAGNIYAGTNYNQLVWHAGNDGSGSGLDSDLLDGCHETSFLRYRGALTSATTAISGIGLYGWGIESSGFGGFSTKYGDSIVFQGHSTWYNRLDFNTNGQIDFWHAINPSSLSGSMGKVGTLAFTHSNVESANRLYTSHTIWGQTFNGTQDVSGNMTGVGSITTNRGITTNPSDVNTSITSTAYWYGLGLGSPSSFVTLGGYSGLKLFTGSGTITMLLNGNVGVNNTSPSYKLDVAGTIRSTTSIVIGDGMLVWDSANKGIYVVNKDGSTPAGFYATGYMSAKGMNTNSSGNDYMMFSRGYYNPNNLVDIGVREVNSSTNAPTNNAWHQYMTWGTADSGYTFQMANQYTANGRLYYRHKISGSWYSWRSVAELSDLTWGNIASKPTTLSGYGISDAYTKTESDSRYVNTTGDTMTGYLNITTNSFNLKLGAQNSYAVHYETNAPRHWFNKDVNVAGNIYAGTNYDKLVLHAGNYTNYVNPANYVTSIGTSGRYLTWTKNGNTNNIFVPFAENAMILWMENSSVGTNYIASGNGKTSSWSVQSIFIKAQCGIGVYNASDTCTMVLDASAGNISLKGQLWQSSDMRLKSNIQDLTFRGRLRPKSFIRNNRQEIGFIAQDVQVFYPELVVDSQDENHYLSLNYSAIAAVLAVQLNNICDRTETLEDKVMRLETENKTLKSKIADMERRMTA